jgi:hypothetical protein
MGKCGVCGTFVITGGFRDNGVFYCSNNCHRNGRVKESARHIPEDVLEPEVRAIFDGVCPNCGGPGPVDLRDAHYIWSAFFVSGASTGRELSCRSCARRRQFRAVLYCSTLGWWSVEGFLFTPVHIFFNMYEAIGKRTKTEPSKALRKLISRQIADNVLRKMESDRIGRARKRPDWDKYSAKRSLGEQ